MTSSFIEAIKRTKRDTMAGERLFKDTERFFKKTQARLNMLNSQAATPSTRRSRTSV